MNGAVTTTAAMVAAAFGFSLTWTLSDLTAPPTRNLTLELLQYNGDGTVTQRLSGGVPAMWTARITRPAEPAAILLCSGSGDTPGIYTGQVSTWSTSDWTGDDCPPLRPGDVLSAAWTYQNHEGFLVTTIGQVIVPDTVSDLAPLTHP